MPETAPENNTKRELSLEDLPEALKALVLVLGVIAAAWGGSDLGREDYSGQLKEIHDKQVVIEKKQDESAEAAASERQKLREQIGELTENVKELKQTSDGTLARVIRLEVEAEQRDKEIAKLAGK